MLKMKIQLNDKVVLMLEELIERGGDLSPAMAKIKSDVFDPIAIRSWNKSGLRSRSGALLRSITPFSGRVSAGIGLRARGGRFDKGLVFAKAHTHTFGRKKWSSKRAVYRAGWRMGSKGALKWSEKILDSWHKVKSPWGDIPARPFMPDEVDVKIFENHIVKIIEEYIRVDAP